MKRYWKYIKPYWGAFLLAPLLMLTEVFGEIMLPKLMSLIINNGVANRDTSYIIAVGGVMVVTAFVMAAGFEECPVSCGRGRNRSGLFLIKGLHLFQLRFKKRCI